MTTPTTHSGPRTLDSGLPSGYFDAPAARERLLHHAGQWVGTPFHPHAAVLGAGVDCVNLIAQIYLACGFLKTFAPPEYAMDGGKHNPQSQLTAWLEASGQFALLGRATPCAPGDTLCFKFRSQSEHHAGLKLLGPFFIHCLERRRVEIATLQDRTFAQTLTAIYRPVLCAVCFLLSAFPLSAFAP